MSTSNIIDAAKITASSGSWQILAAAGQHLPKVLLYGPPGTGKTYLAQSAGVDDETNVYRVICTEDTPAAELRGHWVPRGNEFVWHDGPAMLAYRHGGRLVVDEITRATDDALSFLLAVLDGHPIALPNGEIVTPSPNLSVWGTTNDDPSALTDALADRFTVKVECRDVNPEALALLPPELARAVAVSGSGISYRQAQEYVRLRDVVGDAIAGRLIWESRSRDVLYGLQTATKFDGSETRDVAEESDDEESCDCDTCKEYRATYESKSEV